MEIERTEKEIVIRVDAKTDLTSVQRLLDFIKFREITSKSKATQKQIGKIVPLDTNLAILSSLLIFGENARFNSIENYRLSA